MDIELCLTDTGDTPLQDIGPNIYVYSNVDNFTNPIHIVPTINITPSGCPITLSFPENTTEVKLFDPESFCCVTLIVLPNQQNQCEEGSLVNYAMIYNSIVSFCSGNTISCENNCYCYNFNINTYNDLNVACAAFNAFRSLYTPLNISQLGIPAQFSGFSWFQGQGFGAVSTLSPIDIGSTFYNLNCSDCNHNQIFFVTCSNDLVCPNESLVSSSLPNAYYPNFDDITLFKFNDCTVTDSLVCQYSPQLVLGSVYTPGNSIYVTYTVISNYIATAPIQVSFIDNIQLITGGTIVTPTIVVTIPLSGFSGQTTYTIPNYNITDINYVNNFTSTAVTTSMPLSFSLTTLPNYLDSFITTWTVPMANSSGNFIRLPFYNSSYYSGSIYWGDNTFSAASQSNSAHTYSTPGTYTVSMNGLTTGFTFKNTVQFSSPTRLKLVELNRWGTMKRPNGDYSFMFYSCDNLTMTNVLDVPDLSPSNITFESMFEYCGSLTTVAGMNSWDTSNVKNMSRMFANCTAFTQNISNWNVSGVTNMTGMFDNSSSFNEDISGWNVSNVTSMNGMFFNSSNFNQNISNWNTSKVVSMYGMFYNSTNFNQNLGSWVISGLSSTGLTYMLDNCGMDTNNYNQTLIGWYQQVPNIPSNLTLGAIGRTYSGTSAAAARLILTSPPYNWSIVGDSFI